MCLPDTGFLLQKLWVIFISSNTSTFLWTNSGLIKIGTNKTLVCFAGTMCALSRTKALRCVCNLRVTYGTDLLALHVHHRRFNIMHMCTFWKRGKIQVQERFIPDKYRIINAPKDRDKKRLTVPLWLYHHFHLVQMRQNKCAFVTCMCSFSMLPLMCITTCFHPDEP